MDESKGTTDRAHTPLRIVIVARDADRLLNTQAIFEIEESGADIIISVSFEGLTLQVMMLISLVSKKFVILLKNSFTFRIVIRFKFSRATILYFFKRHHQLNCIFLEQCKEGSFFHFREMSEEGGTDLRQNSLYSTRVLQA